MQEGNEEAFLRLIKDHQNIIHKICFVYCRTKADKEDMHQEIVLQLWKSFPSFKGNSDFSTWMYRVALNTALSATKKPGLFILKEDTEDIGYDAEGLSDQSEDIKVLYNAISILKKIDRAIILLWLEDKSYDEIAETIGISVKNVSVRIVRIKKKLSETIKSLSR